MNILCEDCQHFSLDIFFTIVSMCVREHLESDSTFEQFLCLVFYIRQNGEPRFTQTRR